MDINNLRTMAMYTDIMTNGATQASKMVDRLQKAEMATSMASSMQKQSAQLQAQAVAKLMGIGENVDTMA